MSNKKSVIKKNEKTNKSKILYLFPRMLWFAAGLFILYELYDKCLYTNYGCNNVVVIFLGLLGLIFLEVAGLPCHKLVELLSKK